MLEPDAAPSSTSIPVGRVREKIRSAGAENGSKSARSREARSPRTSSVPMLRMNQHLSMTPERHSGGDQPANSLQKEQGRDARKTSPRPLAGCYLWMAASTKVMRSGAARAVRPARRVIQNDEAVPNASRVGRSWSFNSGRWRLGG